MRPEELKEWRKRLGLTQEAAAGVFGVSRVTEQNWENGATPVPDWTDDRRETHEAELRRRPEYGPVRLIYWPTQSAKFRTEMARSEEFETNGAALDRAAELFGRPDFNDPFIVDSNGFSLWPKPRLEREVERRLAEKTRAPKREGLAERLMEIGRHFRSLPPGPDPNFTDKDLYDEDGLPK